MICKVQNKRVTAKDRCSKTRAKVVHELVKTLNGNLKHRFGSNETISLLAFPFSDGAQ